MLKLPLSPKLSSELASALASRSLDHLLTNESGRAKVQARLDALQEEVRMMAKRPIGTDDQQRPLSPIPSNCRSTIEPSPFHAEPTLLLTTSAAKRMHVHSADNLKTAVDENSASPARKRRCCRSTDAAASILLSLVGGACPPL